MQGAFGEGDGTQGTPWVQKREERMDEMSKVRVKLSDRIPEGFIV